MCCGASNHYITNCPYLSAVSPHTQGRKNANKGGTPNNYHPSVMNIVQNDNSTKPKIELKEKAKVFSLQYDLEKE